MFVRQFAVAILATLLAAPAALAQTDDTRNANAADTRCLAIGLKMAASTDTTMQQQGIMVSMYFIGRLDGRAPDLDLEESIYAAKLGLAGETLLAERQRCGELLIERGQEVTEMETRLAARVARDKP